MDDIELKAEQVISETEAINELKETEPVTRKQRILEIDALETLSPEEEGMMLNEGYSFAANGHIPQIADALAKMAIEMDKDTNLGEKSGEMFIRLILSFYEQNK